LKILDFSTSYLLWVNGKLLASNGQVGTNRDESWPQAYPNIVDFMHDDGPIEIVIQVANFSHSKGGMWTGVELGTPEQARTSRENQMAISLYLCGALVTIGLYHVVLYLVRRRDKSPLFFALLCILIAVRSSLTDEIILLRVIPNLSWDAIYRLLYLSFYLAVPAFMQFIYLLYPKDVSKPLTIACWIIAAVFSIGVILTPATVYTKLILWYEAFALVTLLYVLLIVLFRALWRRREGALLFFVGTIAMVASAVNDMLIANGIIHGPFMLHLGMFVFLFSQTTLLAIRFSSAFDAVAELSEELAAKNESLVRLDKLKDEFLAYTTHELRTPLNGIVNMAESVVSGAAGPLTETQAHRLSLVVNSGRRLSALINDILDYSRLKHKDIVLYKSAVDLAQVTRLALEVCGPMSIGKPVRLENRVDSALPPVDADENRLMQVMYNLVGNAVKYTDKGVVAVSAREVDGMVEVTVSDTGAGISEDQHAAIFEPFEQVGGDRRGADSIATAGAVDLTAGGIIAETGAGKIENAVLLSTQSNSGQTLTGANTVRAFLATNFGSGDIELVNTSDLTISGISQNMGDIVVDSAEDVMVAGSVVTAEGDMLVQAVQDITIADRIETSGNVNLTAGSSITETGEGRIENAALLSTTSTGGQILTGANTVGALDAVNHGGGDVVVSNTADALLLNNVGQAGNGDVFITNSGDLSVKRVIAAMGAVDLVATGSILRETVTKAAPAAVNGVGTGTWPNIRASDIILTAQNGSVGNVGTGTRVSTASRGETNVSAGLDIYVEELDDLDSSYMVSNSGRIDLLAGGDIQSARLESTSAVRVETQHDVEIRWIGASEAWFILTGIGRTLHVVTAEVAAAVTANADSINFANLIHTGTNPIRLSMGGGSRSMADMVIVHASSGVGMEFSRLEVDKAIIDAQVDDLAFKSMILSSRADINNRYHTVIADRQVQQLHVADVQLQPGSDPFYLILQREKTILTDARVVNYDGDYVINGFANDNSVLKVADRAGSGAANGSGRTGGPGGSGSGLDSGLDDGSGSESDEESEEESDEESDEESEESDGESA